MKHKVKQDVFKVGVFVQAQQRFPFLLFFRQLQDIEARQN